MTPARTSRPFGEVLPDLARERGLSVSEVARRAGVHPSFLLHLARGTARVRRPSLELVEKVAHVLHLPRDYFVEWRENFVIDRIRSDPTLRDELYDRLAAE